MSHSLEILLVEDNPDDVELALHALRKNKLANHVEVMRDGAEALDFLFAEGDFSNREATDTPRLILLDLKLPKVDGLEVLRRVKSDPKLRTVPIVIMTSSDHERDIVESYQYGVNSYIRKPVDFDEFVEVIKQLGFYWLILNQPPKKL